MMMLERDLWPRHREAEKHTGKGTQSVTELGEPSRVSRTSTARHQKEI
jgi:hypothetical protein